MNKDGKIFFRGKIRVLSPVHIGGAQEKHLQRGLDYIEKEGIVYFLDERKLIDAINVASYSDALYHNNLKKVLDTLRVNYDDVSFKVEKRIIGEIGTDIKSNIKNPLSGKPIIPGSSLKGALRSIIYNEMGGGYKNKELDVFGNISEDILRFLIVSDIEFNSSSYVNTKTFNLIKSGIGFTGAWKHHLNGQNNESFSVKGFTFPCETIMMDDFGDFSIVINQDALNLSISKGKVKVNDKLLSLFNGGEDAFFNMIKKYTRNYIDAEIDFFNEYNGDKTELIVNSLMRIKELNEESPVLRVGFGSGFHSMTGDTIHEDHFIDEISIVKRGVRTSTRGFRNNKNSSKSRKIAFCGAYDEIHLYPMGFVQLMKEEQYSNKYKQGHQKRLNQLKEAKIIENKKAIQAEKMLKQKMEEAKLRAEELELKQKEALKPKMTEVSLLKKAKYVDGIVRGQNGKNIIFTPFVVGFENQTFEIRYPSGIPKDTVIQVMCQKSGKTIQFQGAPKVKTV